jgi:phosphate transport system substrate-binding protein
MARPKSRPESWVVSLCVLVAAASLAGCTSSSKSTASHVSTTPAPTPTSTSTLNESPQCAKGSLHLIGSTAFEPIAQQAADTYMNDCPGAAITVTGGDSDYGLTQVRDAVASHSPSAGSMVAMYDGVPSDTAGLSPYPMGVLIEAIVAHSGLFTDGNITTAELQKIFVKPGQPGKVAVGRRAGSGTRRAFDMTFLGSNPGEPDKGNCPPPTGNTVTFTSCTEDSTPDLLKFVNGTPNAIGYAAVAQLGTSYPQVSTLSVNDVAPSADSVRNKTYGFWAVENLFASTQPTALTTDFLNFLSHYRDPKLPPGFIPCYDAPAALGTGC